jgi:gamma-glutamyltranspeptidase / glutathione hydrolase
MRSGKSVVAAGHRLTAAAAAEILEDGGNAFDAAFAGLCVSFVAEAAFASPGGGGFLMVRDAKRDATSLYDAFADTPRRRRPASEIDFHAIHADFGPARQEFHIGVGASATPGIVAGMVALHRDLCRLPMRRLVEPAVRAAREGFPLSDFQAYLFTVIAPILTASAGAAKIFAPDGRLLRAGETFRNPDLADTLEWLAEDGARLFVDGDIGQAIVAQSASLGGYLIAADLADYRVERREPLFWRHGRAVVALNPPPAAGGALIACGLGLLAGRPGDGPPDSFELIEAMRATNAARAAHGDHLGARLAGGLLAAELRQAARHPAAARGTTHISVVDAAGNGVAASLSNGEGNGHVVGTHGFMLNNMLGEEDLTPGGLGTWREGVRLSSMMAPTIIEDADGSVTALGTGGSNRIRTAILQVTVNLLDRRMRLEAAVEAPRLHLEKDGTLSFEPGFTEAEETAFRTAAREAQAWPEANLFFGGVHAVRRFANGAVEGAGDPRRRGVAVVV